MNASGDASSTTKSGISHADIKITDEAKQRELTGKDAATTISELNRDVSSDTDTSNSLNPIFDPDKIQANFDIVSAFSREANTFLTNRIKEADDKRAQAKEALKNANDPTNGFTDAERQSLRDQAHALEQEAQTISDQWGAGGTYRQVTTALVAAASGNVSASNTQFVQNLVVNYVQQQGAAYIGKLVVDGVIKEGSPEYAALHAIVACGGAAASGQSCGAGAAGAAASSLLTNLFGDTNPNETDTEREAKRNLVASLVTGIAALEGGDATAANQAAIAAIDNNWLATQQIVQANKELAEAKTPLEQLQVIGKWSGTSVKQDLLTGGGIVEGLRDAGLDTLQGLGPFLADPMQGVNGLRELINNPEARAKMGDEVYAELITKINRIDNALATGGDGNAIQLGRDLGDLIFQAGVIATGVNGLAKGGAMLARAGINVSTSTLKNMVVSGTRIGLGDSSVASGIKGALLNSENAVIDAQKITNYALNPAHPVGGNKAIVFESALGYNQTNADSLIAQLQKGVSQYPASIGKADQFGQRFTVDIPVQGPNGSTAVVRTGWIYDPGSSTPRLTTLYVK